MSIKNDTLITNKIGTTDPYLIEVFSPKNDTWIKARDYHFK